MVMRPADSIRCVRDGTRATAEALLGYVDRLGEPPSRAIIEFATTIEAMAPWLGIDPAVAFAMWSVETHVGQTAGWRSGGDLRVLGDEVDSMPQDFAIRDGAEAGEALLARLALTLDGVLPPGLAFSPAGERFFSRMREMVNDPARPPVWTIADLGVQYHSMITDSVVSTWAADPIYADEVCRHGNAIFPGLGSPVGSQLVIGGSATATAVSDVATLLSEPLEGAKILGQLRDSDVVTIAGPNIGEFFPVTVNGLSAWAHRAHFVARVVEDVQVRRSPRVTLDDANVIGRLAAGSLVRFGGSAQLGFVGVQWNNRISWVAGQALRTATGDDLTRSGTEATATVNTKIRSTPTLRTDANVIGELAPGDRVVLSGMVTVGFVAIPYRANEESEQQEAWVLAEFLAAAQDAPLHEVRISAGEDEVWPSRDEPEVTGTEVTVLEGGVRLRSSANASSPDNILVDRMVARATVLLTGRGENEFLSIRYHDEERGELEGWAFARFLGARVADRGLRLRSEPDPSSSKNILVNSMDFGTTVTLTGRTEAGFLSVNYRGIDGWTFAQYLGAVGPRGNWSAIWGEANARIGQEFRNKTGPDLYDYGLDYCLNGREHPGVDVAVPYETPLYAPMAGTVTCAGTGKGAVGSGASCGAFNDYGNGWTGDRPVGVGRVELLLDNGKALILGHSRKCFVEAGSRVVAGQKIGTSGGMGGAHIHVEQRVRHRGCRSGWIVVDPRTLFDP